MKEQQLAELDERLAPLGLKCAYRPAADIEIEDDTVEIFDAATGDKTALHIQVGTISNDFTLVRETKKSVFVFSRPVTSWPAIIEQTLKAAKKVQQ